MVRYWHGYLSGARCRLAYGPADATATTLSCFSKIQIGFSVLVPAHPGSPRQRTVKRVCVCVCLSDEKCSLGIDFTVTVDLVSQWRNVMWLVQL